MASFTITVQDQDIRALLQRLNDRLDRTRPVLQAIGDDMVERTKRRFETSTGPDGQPWKANAPATLGLLADRLGKSYRKKNGDLNTAGQKRLAGKKPLIGESGDLRRQIVAIATAEQVTVHAAPRYAAVNQFGGRAGRGLKVEIPARPFLPVMSDGSLYPDERALVLKSLNDFLLEL